MNLIKALISFIEKNEMSYDSIAQKMGMGEEDLKNMLLVEQDFYLSELDEILHVLNISYADLAMGVSKAPSVQTMEGSLTMILDSANSDEKNVVKQVMEAIESMDSMIRVNTRNNYMN